MKIISASSNVSYNKYMWHTDLIQESEVNHQTFSANRKNTQKAHDSHSRHPSLWLTVNFIRRDREGKSQTSLDAEREKGD